MSIFASSRRNSSANYNHCNNHQSDRDRVLDFQIYETFYYTLIYALYKFNSIYQH